MLERHLILWLSLLSLVAYFWSGFLPAAPDPFLATRPYLSHFFAATMFAVGCLIPRQEMVQVARRWPSVLGGTVIQYSAMPLLAFLCAHLVPLTPESTLGLIVVGCVPGAMASNVLTLVARGNVSYSVSLTTSATLLSPLIVPVALWVTLSARVYLDPLAVSFKLLTEVVGPLLAGHLLSRTFRRVERAARIGAAPVASLFILWIIAVVVALNRTHLSQVEGSLLGALLGVNLLGYGAGSLGGKLLGLEVPLRRALTLEVGMQNAGLGTLLVLSFFPDQPAAAIPPAAYTFGCMLTGTALAQFWARRGFRHGAPGG